MICLKNLEILVEEKKKEIDAAIEYEFRKKFRKICKITYFSTSEEKYEGKIYFVNIIKDSGNFKLMLCVSKNNVYLSKFTKNSSLSTTIKGSNEDSIVNEINDWMYKRYNLMYTTDYLHNQKNCILILLTKTQTVFRYLPFDIIKIIIKKILFASLYLDPLGSK
jgi:hypothetical protein